MLLALATPSHAADPSAPSDPGGAEAQPPSGDAPAKVVISDEAKAHFRRGVNLLDDPDGRRYEEAYHAFKAAFAASPSPKILGNLGQCAMKLERDSEAIEALGRYLAEVEKIDPVEREQLTKDLATLKAGVTPLQIEVSPAGATVVDEREPVRGDKVINRYGPLQGPLSVGIRAGHHRITVKLEGHEPQTWEVEAVAQQPLNKTFALLPSKKDTQAPVTERPTPLSVWITAGVSGALAVTTIGLGAAALSNRSDYNDVNNGSDEQKAKDLRDSGQALNIATDVMLGTSLIAAGVTAYLFFTRPEVVVSSEPEQEGPPLDVTATIVPMIGPDGGGLAAVGRF